MISTENQPIVPGKALDADALDLAIRANEAVIETRGSFTELRERIENEGEE
jgi:hypothetical protein